MSFKNPNHNEILKLTTGLRDSVVCKHNLNLAKTAFRRKYKRNANLDDAQELRDIIHKQWDDYYGRKEIERQEIEDNKTMIRVLSKHKPFRFDIEFNNNYTFDIDETCTISVSGISIISKREKYGGLKISKYVKNIKGRFARRGGSHQYPRLHAARKKVIIQVEGFPKYPILENKAKNIIMFNQSHI